MRADTFVPESIPSGTASALMLGIISSVPDGLRGLIILRGACALAAFLGRHCWKNRAYRRIGSEQQH